MIVFFLKTLVRGLFLLALLPLLLALLLRSEGINRWLFEQAQHIESRLQIDSVQGQLWRGWELSGLRWQDEELSVEIDQLTFSWSPNCLYGWTFCVDQLALGNVQLQLAGTAEDAAPRADRIELPEIKLPLKVQLAHVSLDSLRLDDEPPLLTDLQLVAAAGRRSLMIHRFSGTAAAIHWQLQAELEPRGDWPLSLRSQIRLPAVDEQPLSADLRLDGSLQQLLVDVRTRGYLNGRLQGELAPLQSSLPLNLDWQGASFLPLRTLPDSLTLEHWGVQLVGNLEKGVALSGYADFPASGQGVRAEWQGKADLDGVDAFELALFATEDAQQRLDLAARADWSGAEPVAAVQLGLQDFPWQRLYPQDTGDIALRSLTLDAEITGMQADASLSAELTGVAGQPLGLDVQVSANPEQLDVRELLLTTPAGQATGTVKLQLQPALEWQAELLLAAIDPGVFMAQLPGRLSGPLSIQGSLDQQLALRADWAVEGELRQQPLLFKGQIRHQDAAWEIPELLLTQGSNRIQAEGYWREQVAANISLELSRLQTLWPGLSGALSGSVTLQGPSDAVKIAAELNAPRLGFDDFQLARLQLASALTLNQQLPMQLQLNASRLRQGETRIGNLALTLQGDRAQHELALQLERGLVDVDALLRGSLDQQRWRGLLVQGELASDDMVWHLEDSAGLEYQLATGALSMAGHCWQQASASLCFDGSQGLLPEQQIELQLQQFSLASLQHLMPEDIDWEGNVDALVSFSRKSGQAPLAELAISSLDGAISLLHPDQETLTFTYDQISLDARLLARRAELRMQLLSEVLGELVVDARVADPAGTQALSGQYALNGLRLDVLRPFLPQVESLRGIVHGQGELGGSLSAAQISGDLRLREGHVSGRELPVTLDALQVDMQIAGQRAEIDGSWTGGDEGEGSLQGYVAWAPELDLELKLRGEGLPVKVDPYADLRVSPDLRLALQDNQLQVSGQVAVPEGDIVVRELPEQAVRLSPDVVVVGLDAPTAEEAPLPLDISATVRLLIGDQLRLDGFGLTGRLSGQLEVQENLNASGDLNILDGRYRGYGQRLSLRRAQILFAGPISQPFLNIEAVREVGDVTAGLRLTGRAEAPQSSVFSEPAMAQEQALSYLILGRPLGEGSGDNNMLGQAALALGMAGSAPLAKSIASSLGIENFQLETEGSGLMTQVVAAGYLTERLSLRYGVGVFEPANQIALRYDLTRRLYLEAVGGLVNSLDFFYRVDFGSIED